MTDSYISGNEPDKKLHTDKVTVTIDGVPTEVHDEYVIAKQGAPNAGGDQAWPVTVSGLPSGTPTYASGASGTVNVPAGAEVTMIMCHATTAGSLTIGGGSSIPLPVNTTFFDAATPYVGALAVVFTGTDSYYVAWAVP